MKVYLAARFSRREELRGYMAELQGLGYEVTSRWLKEDYHVTGLAEVCAREDFQDVVAADVLVLFSDKEHESVKPSKGGKHVEFGIALGLGKTIALIGDRENVFQHLHSVRTFSEWSHLLPSLPGLMDP